MKKIVLVVLAVCMMCLCFVGCNNTGKNQVKYVLYCGLNDADTSSQVLTVADAQAAARKVIPSEAVAVVITLNVILEFVTTAVDLFCLQTELVELSGSLKVLNIDCLRKKQK